MLLIINVVQQLIAAEIALAVFKGDQWFSTVSGMWTCIWGLAKVVKESA